MPFSNRHKLLHAAVLLTMMACSNTPHLRDTATGATGAAALPADYDRALVLMQSGSHAQAIPVLLAFIAREPELPGPHLNLGIAYRHAGQPDAAIDALSRAIELKPANAVAYHQIAIIHREQGRFDAALDAYGRALEIAPDYALAHRNLGILYDLYLQQPVLALEHYRKYLEFSQEPDSRVSGWIVDLERRTGNAQARVER